MFKKTNQPSPKNENVASLTASAVISLFTIRLIDNVLPLRMLPPEKKHVRMLCMTWIRKIIEMVGARSDVP